MNLYAEARNDCRRPAWHCGELLCKYFYRFVLESILVFSNSPELIIDWKWCHKDATGNRMFASKLSLSIIHDVTAVVSRLRSIEWLIARENPDSAMISPTVSRSSRMTNAVVRVYRNTRLVTVKYIQALELSINRELVPDMTFSVRTTTLARLDSVDESTITLPLLGIIIRCNRAMRFLPVRASGGNKTWKWPHAPPRGITTPQYS